MAKYLQFSDIHHFFRDEEGTDDRQIHIALLDNLKRLHIQGEKIDGVLICGDIAHSCKKEQYKRAAYFIQEICTAINCQSHAVYMVPGNHDKDRTCDHAHTRELIYEKLRSKDGDDYFQIIKNDEFQAIRILYSPLIAYYEFAAQYSCCDSVSSSILTSKKWEDLGINPHDKIYWKETLSRTDNFKLNLFGINSTLTSGEKDTEQPLFLPKLSYNISRSEWDINIAMMHHPITEKNIINHNDVQIIFDQKFHIQLYGHEHKQSSKSKDVIKIYSGALNPHGDYDPEYCPSYNIIDIDIQEESSLKCVVSVDISSHKWDGVKFYKDPNESKKHSIIIDNSDSEDNVSYRSKENVNAVTINMKELQYKFMTRSDRKSLIKRTAPGLYDDEYSEHINSINFLRQLESDKKRTELWNIINQ